MFRRKACTVSVDRLLVILYMDFIPINSDSIDLKEFMVLNNNFLLLDAFRFLRGNGGFSFFQLRSEKS